MWFTPLLQAAAGSDASVTADASITEANDTLSAAATTAIVASSTVTEANDTLSAAATAAIVASSAVTEANDTLSATVVDAGTITADATITEADDTLSSDATNSTPAGDGFPLGLENIAPNVYRRFGFPRDQPPAAEPVVERKPEPKQPPRLYVTPGTAGGRPSAFRAGAAMPKARGRAATVGAALLCTPANAGMAVSRRRARPVFVSVDVFCAQVTFASPAALRVRDDRVKRNRMLAELAAKLLLDD